MGLLNAGAALAFNSGFVSGNRYISLHSSDPGTTGANELSGSNYARLALSASDFDSDGQTNSKDAFNEPSANWSTPTHAGMWSAATNGTLYATWAISGTVNVPVSGADVYIPDDGLDFDFTGFTSAGIQKCIKGGLLSSTLYAALHTAAPTSSNELSGGSYARVTVASSVWSVSSGQAQNGSAITFPTPTATWSTPTHLGFWTASTGGTLYFFVALGSLSAPQIGATVEAAANAVTISFTTDD